MNIFRQIIISLAVAGFVAVFGPALINLSVSAFDDSSFEPIVAQEQGLIMAQADDESSEGDYESTTDEGDNFETDEEIPLDDDTPVEESDDESEEAADFD